MNGWYNSMEVVIDTMTDQDIKDIIKIENSSFADPWSEENFKMELQLKFSYSFVARLNHCQPYKEPSEVVGYIIMRKIQSEGQIVNFAVKGNYRRQGIGRKLLEHIIQVAKTKDINQLYLEVRSKNLPAINLYKLFGFEVVQLRPNCYINDDGYLMYKTLK